MRFNQLKTQDQNMVYSQQEKDAVFEDICLVIAEDGMSLRNVLKQRGMPSTRTFYEWLAESEEAQKLYARACKDRADKIADDIIEISNESNADVYLDKDGMPKIDGAAVQRSRLQVDARKWLLAKLHPKKYGDKLDLNLNNAPVFKVYDARKKED